MIATTENIIKLINKRGYKLAVIYEGFTKEDGTPVDRMTCESPAELIEEIEEFAECFPGKFTIKMRTSSNGNAQHEYRVKWDTLKADKVEVVEATPVLNGKSVEQLRAEWEKEQADKAAQDELKRIIKEQNDQLAEFRTNGGKMAYVGLEILKAWGFGRTGQAPPTMQGTGEKSEQIQNPELLKQSLNKLVQLLGEETIIKLAEKMHPGSSEITIVKSFANS